MKRSLLLGCISLFVVAVFAQEDPVLMRVNGREILRSEFEYAYRRYAERSNARLSSKEYAALFAQSKLKVEAARAAGLDTTSIFRKQQEKCRTELVESYLIDRQVMDSCARAIYQKMGLKARSGRVQVMQIFKRLPQTITSRHLEEEKTRMDSIYRMIQNQPDLNFNRLVEIYSDDKQSRWIECLETTSEFENVAFSLAKGQCQVNGTVTAQGDFGQRYRRGARTLEKSMAVCSQSGGNGRTAGERPYRTNPVYD